MQVGVQPEQDGHLTLWMSNSLATFCADSVLRFATAATVTPSIAANLGMWCSLVLAPAPSCTALR